MCIKCCFESACTHYRSKYVDDFDNISNIDILSDNEMTDLLINLSIKLVSVEQVTSYIISNNNYDRWIDYLKNVHNIFKYLSSNNYIFVCKIIIVLVYYSNIFDVKTLIENNIENKHHLKYLNDFRLSFDPKKNWTK